MSDDVAQYDFRIVRGDTVMRPSSIVWMPNGTTPADLTGYDAKMEISWGFNAHEIELTPGDGLTITAAEGRITPALTEPQSLSLPIGRIARFQLRLTNPVGDLETIMMGYYIVTAEVID